MRTPRRLAAIHDRHRFPRDFPTLDAAAELVSGFIAHPRIWGVVAERDGHVIGSTSTSAARSWAWAHHRRS